jgi:diacylglycerol kinase
MAALPELMGSRERWRGAGSTSTCHGGCTDGLLDRVMPRENTAFGTSRQTDEGGPAPAVAAPTWRREHEGVRRFVASFGHAARGLVHVIKTQTNARFHGAATVLVAAAACWLRPSAAECALLGLAVTLVWAAEAFNTAIEAVVDLVTPEVHPLARIAKDAAAGAVLVCALGAALAGALILGPPLCERLRAVWSAP